MYSETINAAFAQSYLSPPTLGGGSFYRFPIGCQHIISGNGAELKTIITTQAKSKLRLACPTQKRGAILPTLSLQHNRHGNDLQSPS